MKQTNEKMVLKKLLIPLGEIQKYDILIGREGTPLLITCVHHTLLHNHPTGGYDRYDMGSGLYSNHYYFKPDLDEKRTVYRWVKK